MLENILSRFQNREIEVEIDNALSQYCRNQDLCSHTQPIRLSLNLYKLIIAIGTLVPKHYGFPTKRQKFTDFCYMLEWIQNDSEFKIQSTSAVRHIFGAEDLANISEHFGIGISVLLADAILDIDWSTIAKITADSNGCRNRRRPDWRCLTNDGRRTVIVEAKGTTNSSTATSQRREASIQKNTIAGDMKIISSTVLNESSISKNYLLDPPADPVDDINSTVLKATHYAEVFAFLGHAKLSRYFSLMHKRLSDNISTMEFSEKQNSYSEIIEKYASVDFNNAHYAGSFFKIDNNKYLFLGVDKELISFQYFITFKETREFESETNNNKYMLFSDGILIVIINNIDAFKDNVDISSIVFYQDHMTISDIDLIPSLAFENYTYYLFSQEGCEIEKNNENDFYFDYSLSYGNKKYFVKIKKSNSFKIDSSLIESMKEIGNKEAIPVIITNAYIQNFNSKYAIYITRKELKQIVNKKTKITDYLK